eukprot:GFUD01029698.1.p1 GENE.GFUD01029698.1~~GFUD01029698.1.p1  ORF type:complete len:172 (-),score=43.99 GFUD01029698.1:366-881(-)
MYLLTPLVLSVLVVAAASSPQSRPPRPPRPDELASSTQPSTGGKRKPPPPPGAGALGNRPTTAGGAAEGIFFVPPKSNTRWIWDENCKNDRPPFELGRWIEVRKDECLIAFEDPKFHSHEFFCKPSPINDNYKYWYGSQLEAMWTYPEYQYCESVPVCLACPALGRCGPRG